MQSKKNKRNHLNNFFSFIEEKTDLYKLSTSDFPWYKVARESLRNSLPDQTKECFSKTNIQTRAEDFIRKNKLLNGFYDYAFIVKAKMRRKDPDQIENNLFVDIFDYLTKNQKKFIIFEVPSGEPYDLKYLKSKFSNLTIPFEFIQRNFYRKLQLNIENEINIHFVNITKLFQNYIPPKQFENETALLEIEYRNLSNIISRVIICKHIFNQMGIKALFGGMGTHLFSGLNNSFSIIEVEHGFHGNISNKKVNPSSRIYQYHHRTFDYDNSYVLSLSNTTKINTENDFCLKDNFINFGMPEIRRYGFSTERLNQLKSKLRLKNEKVILILTNGHIDYQRIDIFTQKLLHDMSNIKVLFRPHPSYDNIACHTEFMRSLPIVSNEHLYDLLCISDIVVSPPSSVIIEASCFTDYIAVYPHSCDTPQSQIDSLSERYPMALPFNLNSSEGILKWMSALPKKKYHFTKSFDNIKLENSLKKLFFSIEGKIQFKKKKYLSNSTHKKSIKKIIIVTDEFPVLTETFIIDQVLGLLSRNLPIEIWTRKINQSLLDKSTLLEYCIREKICLIKLPPDDIRHNIRQWREAFLRINPGIDPHSIHSIHVHFGWNFNLFEPFLRTTNALTVVSFHGYDGSAFLKNNGPQVYAKLFDRADAITTPSHYMKDALVNSGCFSDKIFVHRYGIDISKFHPVKRSNSNSKVVILTVARLVEKKGIEYALTAFSKIPREMRVSYRIVGDGPLRQKLEQLTRKLSIQDRVKFLGAKDHEEVQKEMANADIFILTSITSSNGDQEGVPVGLIEAQAMGLPVVSSYHAGIPELVAHKKSGYLADEKSVDQISRYLHSLISDPELRNKFSVNARNIVLEHFNIETLNDRLASYLSRNVKESDSKSGRSQRHQTPSISIVIPTHQRPDYLKQAIESALAQDLKLTDTEILIVSDGYDDETEHVIKEYPSNHIRYIQKEHSGAVHTRNRAIDEAKGDYILWLDDDDILEPTTLAAYLETLSHHPCADVIYGILEYFDDRTRSVIRYFDPSDWSIKPKALLGALCSGCRIPNPATLIRKSAYQEVGKYDQNFKRAHDYEFWSRAAASLSFKKCNSIVCRYRVHTDNMSIGDGVDFSYESLIIRKMVKRYGLRNLFHWLDWRDSKVAESAAKFMIAKNLFRFGDYYNCLAILNHIPHNLISKEVAELQFFCALFQGVHIDSFINKALTDKNIKTQYDIYKRLNKKLKKSLQAKNIQQCIQHLNDYSQNNLSPSIDLLAEVGTHLMARGEHQQAKKVVAKACMINPEAVSANERMLDNFEALDRENIHGTIQRVLSPEGLNRFTDTSPQQTNKVITPAEAVSMDDAVVLYESENYRDAYETLSAYTKLHPHDWPAYTLLVDVMLQSGQSAAIPEQLRPLEQRGDLPPHMLALIGSGYEAAGDFERAAKFAERVLAADPDCASAWNLKGVLAFRSGKMEEAEQHFHTATEKDVAWGEPWTNLGTVYWEQGRRSKALDCLEKGFRRSPTAPNVATTYHAAVSETGEYERAKTVFAELVEGHPDFRRARFLLIDILIRLEAFGEALEQIQAVMVRFGIDAQLLQAAKAVRAKLGPMRIDKGKHPSLSLCMIVNNEERYLARCLQSLKPLADEMIVVDTGSSDHTRDIAEIFGARVFDFECNDDFPAARKHSLEQAAGDWILVMDADEVIAPKDHQRLMDLLHQIAPEDSAIVMTTRNYTDHQNASEFMYNSGEYEEETRQGWIPSKSVRIFQNHPSIHSIHTMHVESAPDLRKMAISPMECPIPVHNFGKLGLACTSECKQGCDDNAKGGLSSQDDNGHALKEMAIQAGLQSRWGEAAAQWKSYLDQHPDSVDACLNLTRVMAKSGDFRKANHFAQKAFQLSPDRSETIYNLALSELQTGQASKAVRTAAQMVERSPCDPDGKLLHILAEVCAGNLRDGSERLAKLADTLSKEVVWPRVLSIIASIRSAGFHEWVSSLVSELSQVVDLEEIVQQTSTLAKTEIDQRSEKPLLLDDNVPALFEMAKRSYEKENFQSAFDYLYHIVSVEPVHWESYQLLVDVMLQSGQAAAIPEQLHHMEQRGDLPAHMLALIGSGYEAAGDLTKAADWADQSLATEPACERAWNLKGILAFRSGNMQEAEEHFQTAIEYDATWGEPWTNQGTVHWEQGHHNDALESLEKGFDLSPTAPNVATAYHAAISETGQFERARTLFANVVERHPDFKKARYLLIDLLIRLEAYGDALVQIENLVVHFGPDAQLLQAAKAVRTKVGPMTIQKGTRPSLSLCIIVRDEEKYLPRCLESLKPLVDEMIVVDTGSTDATRDIAEVFGAKVFDFEWNDDFAAARNHSLDKASGDWILVMDADEIIAPKDHNIIHNLLKKSKKRKIAYAIETRNYTRKYNSIDWQPNDASYENEEAGCGWIPSTKTRLFKNAPHIRFDYPVHELVDPSLIRNRYQIRQCNVPVHHYGILDKSKSNQKGEYYYKIGKRKIEQMKDDPNAIHELAVGANIMGDHQEAIELWNRAAEIQPTNVRTFINLSAAHGKLGDYTLAKSSALKAVKIDPKSKQGYYNLGRSEFFLGNFTKAQNIFEKLACNDNTYYSAHFMLGATHICCENFEEGLAVFQNFKKLIVWSSLPHAFQELATTLSKAGFKQQAKNLIRFSNSLDCNQYSGPNIKDNSVYDQSKRINGEKLSKAS